MPCRCRWRIVASRVPDRWHEGDQEHAASSADGRSPAFLLWFFLLCLPVTHIRPHGLQTHTRSPLGVVCMCVAINTTSPNPVTPRTMPSSQPTPSLAANHSKCQTGSRMRTRPFIPDTRHRPSTARVSPSALHRISVSVLFRFYISYFRFGFGFIISARQRTLTNADECTIRIRQFPTPLAQCRVGHCDAPSTGKGMSR